MESTFSTVLELLTTTGISDDDDDADIVVDEACSMSAASDAVALVCRLMLDMAFMSAASPPWESTMVVTHDVSGSGGNRTRVIMPGTTSLK
jgi:hypothetical protein